MWYAAVGGRGGVIEVISNCFDVFFNCMNVLLNCFNVFFNCMLRTPRDIVKMRGCALVYQSMSSTHE